MTWLQRYRVRTFLRSSMWLMPLTGMVAALIVDIFVRWIDRQTGWKSTIGPEGARAVVGTLTSSMFTFIVFVFSILLLAVQLASAQLTPRIIARAFKDRATKTALGIFVFTYTSSLGATSRIEDSGPRLSLMISGYGSLVCIGVFLYLIDRVGRSLRPVSIVTSVGAEGRRVINSVYPHQITDAIGLPAPTEDFQPGEPVRVIEHVGASGIVLAFDVDGLVEVARRAEHHPYSCQQQPKERAPEEKRTGRR